jgi:hypothetical protein
MSDPTQPNWLTYVLGLLMALLASFFEIYRRKIDRIDRAFVSREDFRHYMDHVREDRMEMHRENLSRLDRLGDEMDRVHDRIDALLKK